MIHHYPPPRRRRRWWLRRHGLELLAGILVSWLAVGALAVALYALETLAR